jgi:hypothetical protein
MAGALVKWATPGQRAQNNKISPRSGGCGLRSEKENTMSNSISTLLLRNLSDVFGENDPVRRRAQSMRSFTKTQSSMTPKAVHFVVVTRSIASLE